MNQLVKTESKKDNRHLVEIMASNANLDMQEYARTVRKTCGLQKGSDEEFVAFLMVARRYDLDPLLKEIYAFPAKGGGIVPIVSIDGWVNLMNSHPQFDGVEFSFDEPGGNLISCTCTVYRKDRSRPIIVTEYLAECFRNTDPWKMAHRMLRHKALIQALRYAFGFAGIYDQDEAEKIADMTDITPAGEKKADPLPDPFAGTEEIEDVTEEEVDGEEAEGEAEGSDDASEGDEGDQGEAAEQASMSTDQANEFVGVVKEAMDEATSEEEIEEEWDRLDVDARLTHHQEKHAVAISFKDGALKRIRKAAKAKK